MVVLLDGVGALVVVVAVVGRLVAVVGSVVAAVRNVVAVRGVAAVVGGTVVAVGVPTVVVVTRWPGSVGAAAAELDTGRTKAATIMSRAAHAAHIRAIPTGRMVPLSPTF